MQLICAFDFAYIHKEGFLTARFIMVEVFVNWCAVPVPVALLVGAVGRAFNLVFRDSRPLRVLQICQNNVYTKFGQILSIRSQDIEQKRNSDIDQGQ